MYRRHFWQVRNILEPGLTLTLGENLTQLNRIALGLAKIRQAQAYLPLKNNLIAKKNTKLTLLSSPHSYGRKSPRQKQPSYKGPK
jgi:hypothetical protein